MELLLIGASTLVAHFWVEHWDEADSSSEEDEQQQQSTKKNSTDAVQTTTTTTNVKFQLTFHPTAVSSNAKPQTLQIKHHPNLSKTASSQKK